MTRCMQKSIIIASFLMHTYGRQNIACPNGHLHVFCVVISDLYFHLHFLCFVWDFGLYWMVVVCTEMFVMHEVTWALDSHRFWWEKWISRCQTIMYHQASYIRWTISQDLNVSCLVLQLSLPHPLKLSWEWKYSWSSADRRCSNNILMIKNILHTKVWLIFNSLQFSLSLTLHITHLLLWIFSKFPLSLCYSICRVCLCVFTDKVIFYSNYSFLGK